MDVVKLFRPSQIQVVLMVGKDAEGNALFLSGLYQHTSDKFIQVRTEMLSRNQYTYTEIYDDLTSLEMLVVFESLKEREKQLVRDVFQEEFLRNGYPEAFQSYVREQQFTFEELVTLKNFLGQKGVVLPQGVVIELSSKPVLLDYDFLAKQFPMKFALQRSLKVGRKELKKDKESLLHTIVSKMVCAENGEVLETVSH